MVRLYNALSQFGRPTVKPGPNPKEELHGQPLVCKKPMSMLLAEAQEEGGTA